MSKIPRYLLCFFLLLLPLKFTSYIGSGEMPNCPLNIWEWFIFNGYPCCLTPGIGGLALLVTVLIHRKSPPRWVGLLVFLPLLAGCMGLLRTTELDFAKQWIWHFLGGGCFALAVAWCAYNDPKSRQYFLGCVALSGFLGVIHGWYQHYWGFEELRQGWLEMQARGIPIPRVMFQKLEQQRIYGSFVDPNLYGAHLLLCFPFSLYYAWRIGSRFERPKVGAWCLTGIVGLLYLFAFYWSGSRGAMLGLVAGTACYVCGLPIVLKWRWRWCLPFAAVVLGALLIALYTVRSNRGGMSSASARMDYYRSAVKMFRLHPVTGMGLGEFFPWHLRLKAPGSEVTRNPHSFFFALLGECGVLGGCVALLLVLLPWFCSVRSGGDKALLACSALGGFWIHSMVQFNEQIPGVIYIALALLFFMFRNKTESAAQSGSMRWQSGTCAVLAVIACCGVLRLRGEYLYQLGESYSKRYPGAGDAEILQATKCLPKALGPRRMLMQLYMMRSDYQRALPYAQELVKCAPHRSASYANLGKIYDKLGMQRESEKAYQMADLWYPHRKDEKSSTADILRP